MSSWISFQQESEQKTRQNERQAVGAVKDFSLLLVHNLNVIWNWCCQMAMAALPLLRNAELRRLPELCTYLHTNAMNFSSKDMIRFSSDAYQQLQEICYFMLAVCSCIHFSLLKLHELRKAHRCIAQVATTCAVYKFCICSLANWRYIYIYYIYRMGAQRSMYNPSNGSSRTPRER